MGKQKTHEQFMEDFKEKNIHFYDIDVIGKYQKSNLEIECHCKIDGHVWYPKPNNLLNNRGCPQCAGLIRKTTDIYVNELKEINPQILVIDEYISARKRIKVQCKVDGHIWSPEANDLLKGHGCPVCDNKVVVVGINSISDIAPYLVDIMLNKEDALLYTKCSNKRIDWKCECGNIIKNVPIEQVYYFGLSCEKCSDSISFGEKYIANILSQLNIEYIKQLSKAHFEWCNKYRYDFYIPKINSIIEVHGAQHTLQNGFHTVGGRTLAEEIENDKIKYNLAINNVEHYIVIDVKFSTDEYIRNSINNSDLNILFDLTQVDFNLCYKNSLKSLVVEISKLWGNIKNINKIATIMNISNSTVVRYLNKATKMGLCDYKPNASRRPVVCLENKIIYKSLTDAVNDSHTSFATIINSCRGIKKYSRYNWQYYDPILHQSYTYAS